MSDKELAEQGVTITRVTPVKDYTERFDNYDRMMTELKASLDEINQKLEKQNVPKSKGVKYDY